MSWPASSARSTWGSTVSSKPMMPGKRSPSARIRASRLSRSSALTDFCSWPDWRSSPRVLGAGGALVIQSRYVLAAGGGNGAGVPADADTPAWQPILSADVEGDTFEAYEGVGRCGVSDDVDVAGGVGEDLVDVHVTRAIGAAR